MAGGGEVWLFSGPVVAALCVIWAGLWLALVFMPLRCPGTATRAAVRPFSASPNDVADGSGAGAANEEEDSAAAEVEGGSIPGMSPRAPRILSPRRRDDIDFYRRKLRRMSCYCILASAFGVALVVNCLIDEDPLPELLLAFGPVHQVIFAMAVGHWTVNLWEDWRTRAFLGQGLKEDSGGGMALFPLNLMCTPNQVMLAMYFIHHTVAMPHETQGHDLRVLLFPRRTLSGRRDATGALVRIAGQLHAEERACCILQSYCQLDG